MWLVYRKELSKLLLPMSHFLFALRPTVICLSPHHSIKTVLKGKFSFMLLNAVDNPRSLFSLTSLQHLISCADLKTFLIWLLTCHAHLIFCFYFFGCPISVSSAISSSCPQPPNLRESLNVVFERSSSLLFCICTHPSVISSSLMYLFLILKMYLYSREFSVDFRFECPVISISSSLWYLIDISNLTFLLSTILFPLVHENLLSFSLPISVNRNSSHIILGLKPLFLYTHIQIQLIIFKMYPKLSFSTTSIAVLLI